MAAILNFSKTLKKSPAHLHMVGNVIVQFLNPAAIFNFDSIFEKSLAHPHVARNVMLKFQKNWPVFFGFLRSQENVAPDANHRTESWRDQKRVENASTFFLGFISKYSTCQLYVCANLNYLI